MVHLDFHARGNERLNDFLENIRLDCSRGESCSSTPWVVVGNLDRIGGSTAEENEFGFEADEEFGSC